MPIIEIETPSGIQKVEIAGGEPNQEELQAIQRTFFSDVSSTSPSLEPEIDLATASREELRDYARQRRALGVKS
jgi:DNA replication initiation complex subunit (GINS family)